MADNEAKSASDSKDQLINLYNNKILKYSLTGLNSSDGKEIIDILSDYTWTANQLKTGNTSNNSASYQLNIPYCYVVEMQQSVNSNIMNVINTWKSALDIVTNTAVKITNFGEKGINKALGIAQEGNENNGQTPPQQQNGDGQGETSPTPAPGNAAESNNNSSSVTSSIANGIISGIKSIRNIYEDLLEKWGGVEDSNLRSDVLSPYKYLYLTHETGKKYIFPMLTPTTLLDVTSSWSDSQGGSLKIAGIDLTDKAKKIGEATQFISNIVDVFEGKGNIESSYLEMAKAFNFSAEGPDITTNFVLFNTIKKDAWKKNYRFLCLFLLRNLPFKVTSYSFIPPLLYDIIVPGVKHLPLCYVSNIVINSFGNIRQLTIDNFIKDLMNEGAGSSTMSVPVPEAWKVQITFKCLLSNTANLILDLANAPINITSTVANA